MSEENKTPRAPKLVFKAEDMCSVIEACSKAGVLEIKWNGVEISFMGKGETRAAWVADAETKMSDAPDTAPQDDAAMRAQDNVELLPITDPAQWEEMELANAKAR